MKTTPGSDVQGYYIHHVRLDDGDHEKIWVGNITGYVYPVAVGRHEFSVSTVGGNGKESAESGKVLILVP